MTSVTWLLKNEHKLCYLTLDENESHGIVLEPGAGNRTLRHATEADMVTNQYSEAQLVKRPSVEAGEGETT